MIDLVVAAATGFGTAFTLILAIGAQNAFILRQGLQQEHVFVLCLICAVSDALLIVAGVLGFGVIVDIWPAFPRIMAIAGALFLFFYAAARFWAAWNGSAEMVIGGAPRPLLPAVLTCLALTWLNPHVYLDTLGLIGAVSTQFAWGAPKTAFAIGAVLSSVVFFFSLGFGARLLAPIMRSARAWQILDVLIGCVMLILAIGLLLH